jgi:drug/metabolite transporter (DMT)-like permease
MKANRSTSVLAWKASPLLLGAVGVLCFSITFPATHAAEASFSPVVVGLGRAVPAAALAAIILTARRQPLLPPREILGRMLIVAGTVGIGFGLLSAIALHQVSSVHGAVLTGLIPAATAGMAVLRAGERPRPRYWAALALGGSAAGTSCC